VRHSERRNAATGGIIEHSRPTGADACLGNRGSTQTAHGYPQLVNSHQRTVTGQRLMQLAMSNTVFSQGVLR